MSTPVPSRSETQKGVRTPQSKPPHAEWKLIHRASDASVHSKEKLLDNGWSVPIKQSVSELSASEPGVCLATTSEARKAVKDLKSDKALAVLSPSNIDGQGSEVHVLVEDPAGRWQTRRRFLIQLGAGKVTYMDGKPKKEFTPDSLKVVLSFAKEHTEPETWQCVTTNHCESTNKWLELRAKIPFLDVGHPTRPAGATEMLQVVLFMPVASLVAALRANGTDGVFVRPFIENEQDKLLYRIAPLPVDVSLPAAIRQAAFIGDKAFGVVPYGRGFGIRVKAQDFQEILL